MNKSIITLLILLQSLSLSAQEIVTSFLDKHGKDTNLELTTIGTKMFRTMQDEGLINENLSDIISGLDCIHIIGSADTSLVREYLSSSDALLGKGTSYQSVYQSDGMECLRVAVREEGGTVKELVIVSGSDSSFSLVCLSGDIRMDALTDYSGGTGFETLKDIIPTQYNK